MGKVKERHKDILPIKYKVLVESVRTGKASTPILSELMIISDINDRRQVYLTIDELINKYSTINLTKRNKKG